MISIAKSKIETMIPSLSVDSLLQVHALHNLLEIKNDSTEETNAYTKELERLEWKYLENSINLVCIQQYPSLYIIIPFEN